MEKESAILKLYEYVQMNKISSKEYISDKANGRIVYK